MAAGNNAPPADKGCHRSPFHPGTPAKLALTLAGLALDSPPGSPFSFESTILYFDAELRVILWQEECTMVGYVDCDGERVNLFVIDGAVTEELLGKR